MEELYIYQRDKVAGLLHYDRQANTYSFDRYDFSDDTKLAIEKLSLAYPSMAIDVALSERFVPPDRVNITEILGWLELDYYDRWEIIKRTNGVCVVDPIWFGETPTMGDWYWSDHPLGIEEKGEHNGKK